jgi:hypothetical protein
VKRLMIDNETGTFRRLQQLRRDRRHWKSVVDDAERSVGIEEVPRDRLRASCPTFIGLKRGQHHWWRHLFVTPRVYREFRNTRSVLHVDVLHVVSPLRRAVDDSQRLKALLKLCKPYCSVIVRFTLQMRASA